MLEYSYLLIILLSRLPQNYFNKKTSGIINGSASFFAYGAYRYLLSGAMALALLIAGGFSGISGSAIAISALGAAALGLNLFFSIESLKRGAMLLASMAGSAGLLLPCFVGIVLFDEPMSMAQLGGVLLLIFSGCLLIGYSKELTGKFTLRTLLLMLGSMLSNGLTMVAQKMFSKYLPDTSVSLFSFLAFSFVGVGMYIGLIPNLLDKERRSSIAELPKSLWIYGAGLSIILLTINQLSTLAAKSIPSAIMFSVNDGGATIITAITAAIFFKEKLNARSIAGLIFGIAALLVINIC